jgi:mono/diheme cytochrome c family protein
MNRFAFLLLAMAAMLIVPKASQAQAPAAAGSATTGKELYMSYACYSCHGFDGHGGAGARLSGMKMSQVVFTAYVRNPARMPSYSTKVLTDAQLGDLYAYIKSLPDSPAAKNIPLLVQIMSGN